MAVISVTVYGQSVVENGIAKIVDDSFLTTATIQKWRAILNI